MPLHPPRNYRFSAEQVIWLKRQADKHDEGQIARYLRRLVTKAMREKKGA